jgi:hypothetical protein
VVLSLRIPFQYGITQGPARPLPRALLPPQQYVTETKNIPKTITYCYARQSERERSRPRQAGGARLQSVARHGTAAIVTAPRKKKTSR